MPGEQAGLRSWPHLMGEKGLVSPGSGLCTSLSGCENETGASDQMPKPFSPNRSCLCPPSDKTSRGHSGPGGQDRGSSVPALSQVGPPPVACPQGACGSDLLSVFPDSFADCLWEVSSSSSVSPGKKSALRVLTQENRGEKGPEQSPLCQHGLHTTWL